MATDTNTTLDQPTKAKHCYRCDTTLTDDQVVRVVGIHRTDNHYIEVCTRCGTYLVKATTHRYVPQPLLTDTQHRSEEDEQ